MVRFLQLWRCEEVKQYLLADSEAGWYKPLGAEMTIR